MKGRKLPPMRKETVRKPDGRYLILYRFGKRTKDEGLRTEKDER